MSVCIFFLPFPPSIFFFLTQLFFSSCLFFCVWPGFEATIWLLRLTLLGEKTKLNHSQSMCRLRRMELDVVTKIFHTKTFQCICLMFPISTRRLFSCALRIFAECFDVALEARIGMRKNWLKGSLENFCHLFTFHDKKIVRSH